MYLVSIIPLPPVARLLQADGLPESRADPRDHRRRRLGRRLLRPLGRYRKRVLALALPSVLLLPTLPDVPLLHVSPPCVSDPLRSTLIQECNKVKPRGKDGSEDSSGLSLPIKLTNCRFADRDALSNSLRSSSALRSQSRIFILRSSARLNYQ